MSKVKHLGGNAVKAQQHLIFVHGLSGSIEDTWYVGPRNQANLWPLWLVEDLPSAAVWAVEYNADKSDWSGHALPLHSRAYNLWQQLRLEPKLKHGDISFIGHSLGGLVTIQMLRTIEGDRDEFLSRVHRVVLLGTPHRGSKLASFFSQQLVALPTPAIHDLRLDTPQLNELNYWFRKFVQRNEVAVFNLVEGRRTRFWGLIPVQLVSPESADAGLVDQPTVVDTDHNTINKPENRDAEVYRLVLDFLKKPISERNSAPRQSNEGREVISISQNPQSVSQEDNKHTDIAISQFQTTLENPRALDSKRLGKANRQWLKDLQQRSLFPGYDAAGDARRLLFNLEHGEFARLSNSHKNETIGWCAWIIAQTDPAAARAILERQTQIEGEIIALAWLRIRASEGELDVALSDVAIYDTVTARSASYLVILKERGFEAASQWLYDAKINPADLDDAAFLECLVQTHKHGQEQAALEMALQTENIRLRRCAALIAVVAGIFLTHAISEATLEVVDRSVLNSLYILPLKDDKKSFVLRRRSAKLYSRLSALAGKLSLPSIESKASDWSLWLDLKNPSRKKSARKKLGKSLSNSEVLIRRFLWALECGIPVDLTFVEQEIDRQVALTGGGKVVHAVARLSLATVREIPVDGIEYLERHREQLCHHLDQHFLHGIEIQLLVYAGEFSRARLKLSEAESAGMDRARSSRLNALIDGASGNDTILTVLRENYEVSGSVADLRILTNELAEQDAYAEVVQFGRRLVERSANSSDARMLVIALCETDQQDDALQLFSHFPVLLRDHSMQFLKSRALYEMGSLELARDALGTLREEADSEDARRLHIRIVITSGDWDTLQAFVEEQWSERKNRTAFELLQAGRIAQFIGAARGQQLIEEAAASAPNDPAILSACYYGATSGGWEEDPVVGSWLERAVKLSEKSDDNAPIKQVSFDHITEQIPRWKEHQVRIGDQSLRGEIPLHLVAQGLNQSLVQLTLSSAIWNNEQTDARKRALILSNSGHNQPRDIDARKIVLDPIALLTLSMIDLLNPLRRAFDELHVAHETMAWLFEESTQLRFHQPSRVNTARELRRLATDKIVRVFDVLTPPPETLVREVGHTLAALLSEAAAIQEDHQQKFVVVNGPIWKVGGPMFQNAELGEYGRFIRTTADVVDSLAESGVLTDAAACAARKMHTRRDTDEAKEIPSRSLLLLDETVTSLLSASNLLTQLIRAGFDVVVSPSEMTEAQQLIEYDALAEKTLIVLEKLRAWLEQGIRDGWIHLGRAVKYEGNHTNSWFTHPSVSTLELAEKVDVVCFDDRCINKQASMERNGVPRPILTSWGVIDVLKDRGAIDQATQLEARTTLRRATYSLPQISEDELVDLVLNARVKESRIVETAELRAIRESIDSIKMSDMLQLPHEIPWLTGLIVSTIRTIGAVWSRENERLEADARSDWLLELGNPVSWAHRMNEDALNDTRRFWHVMLSLLPTGRVKEFTEGYGDWLESRVLISLREEEPEFYKKLIGDVKRKMSDFVSELSECDLIGEMKDGT